MDFDQNTGTPIVTLQFDEERAKLFSEMARKSIGRPIAIHLDGTPIGIPVVEREIPSGQAGIEDGDEMSWKYSGELSSKSPVQRSLIVSVLCTMQSVQYL